MTHHLETIAGFVSTIVAAIFGAITLPSLAELATNDGLPDWAKWFLGPLGALVGMIVAIKWLTDRLNRAEAREEKRQAERDQQMATVIEFGFRCTKAIEQNTEVLDAYKKDRAS